VRRGGTETLKKEKASHARADRLFPGEKRYISLCTSCAKNKIKNLAQHISKLRQEAAPKPPYRRHKNKKIDISPGKYFSPHYFHTRYQTIDRNNFLNQHQRGHLDPGPLLQFPQISCILLLFHATSAMLWLTNSAGATTSGYNI
jgi:hypothetical protein